MAGRSKLKWPRLIAFWWPNSLLLACCPPNRVACSTWPSVTTSCFTSLALSVEQSGLRAGNRDRRGGVGERTDNLRNAKTAESISLGFTLRDGFQARVSLLVQEVGTKSFWSTVKQHCVACSVWYSAKQELNVQLLAYIDNYRTYRAQWSLYVPYSGHYIYRQFNIQQFYVLPTQYIYVFCADLRTNTDYFPVQH